MATLVEKYAKRVNLAEKLYAKRNGGAQLSAEKKMVLANVLNNQAQFFNSRLTEAFDNSVSLQRNDVGSWVEDVKSVMA